MILDPLPEFRAIVDDDIYSLRAIPRDGVDVILDIGANRGTFVLTCRILFPNARIIAYEPDAACFEELRRLSKLLCDDHITIRHEAFGDGNDFTLAQECRNALEPCALRNVYQPVASRSIGREAHVRSRTLGQIFDKEEVDTEQQRVLVKFDCEGGERHLVEDPNSPMLLESCCLVALEVHFATDDNTSFWNNLGFPKLRYYHDWIHSAFHDMEIHEGRFRRDRGFGIYLMRQSSANFEVRR